jgi:hypothetical protein
MQMEACNAHAAAKHFDITRSVLIGWLAKKDLLQKSKGRK